MYVNKAHKVSRLAGVITAILLLNACDSNDNNDEVIIEPDNAAIPAQPEITRGVLNQALISGELPAGSLPAASLPAASLPAVSLPTFELEESPSIVELRTLSVTMQASQEVGAEIVEGDSVLTAIGNITVNENTGAIIGTVVASNIATDDAVTMVHIHSGFAGENGPVLIGFTVDSNDPTVYSLNANISDLADFTGNDLETFLDGGWYLNLHTTSNPSGHVRGQIFTNDVDVARTELQGQQENPAIINADGISGIGYVTLNPSENEIVANVRVEGFTPFLDAPIGPVHLHTAFAGENGAVFLPLNPVDGSDTIYRATEADAIVDTIDFALIADGGTYINVHSAENAGGELRGQIVPQGIDVTRSELQGQQENPAIINADGISGVGYVTINAADQAIVGNVTVEGFVPFLDAPIGPVHLHNGFAGENGAVFLPLFAVSGSDVSFRGTEVDATETIDFSRISQGGTYINVHSAENAGGEIRGQVVPRNVDVARTELQGQQENSAVINAEGVSGVGYVTTIPEQDEIVANVTVEGFTPFLDADIGPVHLHNGFAGENGGVFLPLRPVEGSSTVFRATSLDSIDTIDFERIADGGTYINVHSAENGSGEVRGQVVPQGVDVSRTELQGQQENPVIVNAEGVSGVGYVTVNELDESIVGNVTVAGFVPFLDAPIGPVHLHNGFAGENGAVFLPLFPVDDSETVFSGTELDAIDTIDFDRIASGGTYINVHSAENGGGEIRGQVLTNNIDVIRSELQTEQEVPAIVTAISDDVSGIGYITFDNQNSAFTPVANVTVSGFDATDVHVHRGGVAGVAGPVQISLTDVSPSDAPGTVFTSNDGAIFSLNGFLNGAYYFNAHSVVNPAGEIRGQILNDNVSAFRAEVDSSQVLSESASTTSTGVGFITVNLSTEGFNANFQAFDFEPDSVSLNVVGDNNNFFRALTNQENGFFSAQDQVFNLQGLLNGAYSIQTEETAP